MIRENSSAERTIGEGAKIHDGLFDHQLANHQRHQAHHAESGKEADVIRREPVLPLAGIENHLKRAEAECQQPDSPQIDAPSAALYVGWIGDEPVNHRDRENPYRKIQIEDPAPGVAVRDPPAQGRAKNGREQDANAVGSHGVSVLFSRERLQKNGLRERLEPSARQPLQHTEDDEAGESGCETAQQGCYGEAANADQQQLLAPQVPGQPARHGQNNGVHDQVGRDHPGAFFNRRRQIASNVRNRDVDDGCVQQLHERRHHHGDGDDPRIHVPMR